MKLNKYQERDLIIKKGSHIALVLPYSNFPKGEFRKFHKTFLLMVKEAMNRRGYQVIEKDSGCNHKKNMNNAKY